MVYGDSGKRERDIYSKLSKAYNIDKKIVEFICKYPFSFANKVIRDDEDEKPIMFAHFGKIRLKSRIRGRKKEEAENTKRTERRRLLEARKRYYNKKNSIENE